MSTSMASTSNERNKQTNEADLNHDEIFHVLRNQRRRFALHYLFQQGGKAEIGELANQIAAWENQIEQEKVNSTQRKRVYTSLQQTHLPKLDKTGIVDYEKNRGTVTVTEAAEELDIYLELVSGQDIPWSKYYLGLGALGLSLVLGNLMGISVLGEISGIAYGLFLVVSLIVSAAINIYYQAQNRLGKGEKPPEIRQRDQ